MIRWVNYARKRKADAKTKAKGINVEGGPAPAWWDLVVVNLTDRYKSLTTNLDEAIAALNFQVEEHFQPEWKVGGKLINKTAEFNLHLTRLQRGRIVSRDSTNFAGILVDWIVGGDHGIDWSTTGIVYLTDPQADFGGVHLHKDVEALDIPYALVGCGDKFWPVVFSHEVLELLADPLATRFVQFHSSAPFTTYEQDSSGRLINPETTTVPVQEWIVEVCDSVEANEDSYLINGIPVSNFISQAYFDTSKKTNIDYKNQLERTDLKKFPFPIRKKGYLSFWPAGQQDEMFYQITWFGDTKEPVYIRHDLSNQSHLKRLREQVKLNHNHRIFKYWQARRAHLRLPSLPSKL